jgi:hypothetical protein
VVQAFQDEHGLSGPGQVGGGSEAVVATTGNNHVITGQAGPSGLP